ncbi:MAG: VanZ family protein [Bacteroidales bacterium]|nr:VanZ family protein [Bacteroidales bacterium]
MNQRTIRYKRLFYIYTAALILLAVLPVNGLTPETPLNDVYIVSIRLDYLLHCIVFIPWVFFLERITGLSYSSKPLETLVMTLGGMVFAAGMEAVQYLLPYRGYNINDLLANALGVFIGVLLFFTGLSFPRLTTPKRST